ncbi:acetyl/propionyl/methylcrotonyl-CoA carboxylase subunit alpha [Pseudohaliea rubra]|uniref:Biotin carboxylase n=1 Tax=Pseudohaliea rubra DSM 19751 TaxID=1265313 RepID=A0A095VN53_9GAMM|nr:acetyl-CoA carboxylase biotin carboxylase subunit [Pseudohaliea rubra]KGE02810.1 Methylcrotonyl-CoA carboxylase biotin-containing subunit [Pseudohaliea rubra DSM 19751]
MFRKVLIANRGEIACRVIRTCRRLGIGTVAVYSDADASALHVTLADEAVHLGPAPARESYLRGDAVLEAARRTGAGAIHPGYGFLSENAAFADACETAGVVFIGPPASAIAAMGSKAAAKQIMEKAGVPLIPGYHGDDQNPATLRGAADAMGYPVLLKATAGGGGKGMRVVESDDGFDDALAAAKREAAASFGDERMLVEKYLGQPRHVEVQVFCDGHGGAVYLAERDCSVQRRHQKVLEEAPAPGVDAALRARMGAAAVEAARAIDYRGAGTVEFLLDADGQFYFMEMNTRLQVEHPVTELITGQDLVEWQLRVAAGQPLPLAQDEIVLRGHAIEARVYAEDAEQDFLPATGRLTYHAPPPENRHVRVDSGVRSGDEISMHYDPMIAKLVVWDENRDRALDRLAGALRAYRIAGTVTNLGFLYNLATTSAFREARLDTGFIERHRAEIFREAPGVMARDSAACAAALACLQAEATVAPAGDPHSPWAAVGGWRMNAGHRQQLTLHCHGRDHDIAVEHRGAGEYRVTVPGPREDASATGAGDPLQVAAAPAPAAPAPAAPPGTVAAQTVAVAAASSPRQASELRHTLPTRGYAPHGAPPGASLALDLTLDGHHQRVLLVESSPGWTLFFPDRACPFHAIAPATGEGGGAGALAGLTAPMNGRVIALLAEPGAAVSAGTPLMILEAMKMEHTVKAPVDGTVDAFRFAAGDLVDGGAALVAFTPTEDAA